MEKQLCIECREGYWDGYDDFEEGVCAPCRSMKDYEEWERKEAEQLKKWNLKTGNNYDADTFYYDCDKLVIKREDLKGFSMLKEIWDYAKSIRDEIAYWDEYERNKKSHPSLFDEIENQLPF